jgi:hypothetical protein
MGGIPHSRDYNKFLTSLVFHSICSKIRHQDGAGFSLENVCRTIRNSVQENSSSSDTNILVLFEYIPSTGQDIQAPDKMPESVSACPTMTFMEPKSAYSTSFSMN